MAGAVGDGRQDVAQGMEELGRMIPVDGEELFVGDNRGVNGSRSNEFYRSRLDPELGGQETEQTPSLMGIAEPIKTADSREANEASTAQTATTLDSVQSASQPSAKKRGRPVGSKTAKAIRPMKTFNPIPEGGLT